MTDLSRWKDVEVLPLRIGGSTRPEGTGSHATSGPTGPGAESEEDVCGVWLCMCCLPRSSTGLSDGGTEDHASPSAHRDSAVNEQYRYYGTCAGNTTASMNTNHMKYEVAAIPSAIGSFSLTADDAMPRD